MLKIHQIIHLKSVYFIICKCYLSFFLVFKDTNKHLHQGTLRFLLASLRKSPINLTLPNT